MSLPGFMSQLSAYIANPPAKRHSSVIERDSVVANPRMKAARLAAVVTVDKNTQAKYREALGTDQRTIEDLVAHWENKWTYSGVALQLRKYLKRGLVRKVGVAPGTRSDLWEWIHN